MIAVSGLTAITPNPGRHSWAGWRPCRVLAAAAASGAKFR